MAALEIGISRSSSRVITPVRPMPPAVAWNSGSPGASRRSVAAGRRELDPLDVLGERAVAVVVLAVDVGREGAAERDEAGPGRDGHEPAVGHQQAHQAVQAEPGLGDHAPALAVERAHGVHALGHEHAPAGVLGGVPVGPPQAARRDAAAVGGAQQGRDLLGARRALHLGGGGRGAPPAGQQLAAHVITPSARHSSQTAPIPCRTRSPSTISSGSSPCPWSTSSP